MDEEDSRNIGALYRMAKRNLKREIKDTDLGDDVAYLRYMNIASATKQSELAKAFCIDEATITRAVDRMVKSGYIIKTHSKKDKRSFDLLLTEKAYEAIEDHLRIAEAWAKVMTADFSEDEVTQFSDLLSRASANCMRHMRQDDNVD